MIQFGNLHLHCEAHSDWAATRKWLLRFTSVKPDETPPGEEERGDRPDVIGHSKLVHERQTSMNTQRHT